MAYHADAMLPLFFLYVAMAAPPLPLDAVLVPAGESVQGSGRAPDEPLRTVTLSAFRVDREEVTVAAFERFASVGYQRPELWSEGGRRWLAEHPGGAGRELRAAGRPADHPVVAVTWYEADAFCRWREGALPTEAQWERAACGDGARRYPWGESEDVPAVWYGGVAEGHVHGVKTQAASAQESHPDSPFGLRHAVGSVWEWTADWYHRDAYLGPEPAVDPTGPAEGTWRTLRGGSFSNLPSYCTCSHREPARPERVAFTTGFRCVYPPP